MTIIKDTIHKIASKIAGITQNNLSIVSQTGLMPSIEYCKLNLLREPHPELEHSYNEIIAYPPPINAVKTVPVDKLFYGNRSNILKIQDALGLTEDEFNRLFMPVLLNYLDFVYLLPASENHHHSGQGGAFAHALDVAVDAAISSHSVVVAQNDPPAIRRQKARYWRLMTCVAGLLHDAGKPISDYRIVSGSKTWEPFTIGLYSWLLENRLDYYQIHWQEGRYKSHEIFTYRAISRIVPDSLVMEINKVDINIMRSFYDSFFSMTAMNTIARIVTLSDQRSVYRDFKDEPMLRNKNPAHIGMRVTRIFFKEMIHLVRSGYLTKNETGASIWHTTSGTFLNLHQLNKKVFEKVKEAYGDQIEVETDELAHEMCLINGIEPRIPVTEEQLLTRQYSIYWEIVPKSDRLRDGASNVSHKVVKVSHPEKVFPDGSLGDPINCVIKEVLTKAKKGGSHPLPAQSSIIAASNPYADPSDTSSRHNSVVPVLSTAESRFEQSNSPVQTKVEHENSDSEPDPAKVSQVKKTDVIKKTLDGIQTVPTGQGSQSHSTEISSSSSAGESQSAKLNGRSALRSFGLVRSKPQEGPEFDNLVTTAKNSLQTLKIFLDQHSSAGEFVYFLVCRVLFSTVQLGVDWFYDNENRVSIRYKEGFRGAYADAQTVVLDLLKHGLLDPIHQNKSQDRMERILLNTPVITLNHQLSNIIKNLTHAFEPFIDPKKYDDPKLLEKLLPENLTLDLLIKGRPRMSVVDGENQASELPKATLTAAVFDVCQEISDISQRMAVNAPPKSIKQCTDQNQDELSSSIIFAVITGDREAFPSLVCHSKQELSIDLTALAKVADSKDVGIALLRTAISRKSRELGLKSNQLGQRLHFLIPEKVTES